MISDELRRGIEAYNRKIEALGGYGTRVRATVLARVGPVAKCGCGEHCACTDRRPVSVRTVDGRLIELGFGGCQPAVETDDGKRIRIDLAHVSVLGKRSGP